MSTFHRGCTENSDYRIIVEAFSPSIIRFCFSVVVKRLRTSLRNLKSLALETTVRRRWQIQLCVCIQSRFIFSPSEVLGKKTEAEQKQDQRSSGTEAKYNCLGAIFLPSRIANNVTFLYQSEQYLNVLCAIEHFCQVLVLHLQSYLTTMGFQNICALILCFSSFSIIPMILLWLYMIESWNSIQIF